MIPLSDGLCQLPVLPFHSINAYLLGDVLVDAGTRWSARMILRELKGHVVRAHALTHAHPDHQGASRNVCETLGIPFWCGAADAAAAEDPRLILQRMPKRWIGGVSQGVFGGPGRHVDRRLKEGDEVGDFVVLETPGHTSGHLAFWRESDRALVLGDVLNNMNLVTTRPGLREPPSMFTADPSLNRASARRLAALCPALVCFGHGPPLRDSNAFRRFVEEL